MKAVWSQLGTDIDGEAAFDESGRSVSLSSDGTIMAIGAYGNDGNGSNSGHVRVYQYDGTAWSQLGGAIDGEAAGDESGYSVSLSSDGKIVAIGATYNDGNSEDSNDNRGHVRVFEYTNDSWSQLGGAIDGEAAYDRSGYSVSLSGDGTIVAIGANYNDGNTGDVNDNRGHVRVFEYTNDSWSQLGGAIDGEAARDESGYSVSLSSDGSIVAIGARYNDGNTGNDSGHVRVYEWKEFTGGNYHYSNQTQDSNQTKPLIITPNNVAPTNGNSYWTQMGSDIDGEAAYDYSGWSVSLSNNGDIVAIGAYGNDGNGSTSGHVRVYEWKEFTQSMVNHYHYNDQTQDNSNQPQPLIITPNNVEPTSGNFYWTQMGQDIDGEAAYDESGNSVSLSGNGTIVAIGATGNDGTNGSDSGHVRVYQYDTDSSSWSQLGQDIDGKAAGDRSGYSVSLSDDKIIVAIGAPYNDGTNGSDSGHVRVYEYTNGYTLTDFKNVDYTASALKAEFTLAELKAADYTASALKAEFTLAELKAADFTATQLKAADFTASQLKAVNFTAAALKAADFTATQLKIADFTATQLRFSGFNLSEVIYASYPFTQIFEAGYSIGVSQLELFKQLGQDIDGEASYDYSGYSVSLSSDGTIVAIGAIYNDGNGSNSGHVRVYQYSGGTWNKMGTDIDGEAANDNSGTSVSLSSDGSIVAIGAIYNDANGNDSGHVRVFEWKEFTQSMANQYYYSNQTQDSNQTKPLIITPNNVAPIVGQSYWTQMGIDIDGEAAYDNSGYSVSLSSDGTIVAIGANYNNGNGVDSGHVRVYEWKEFTQSMVNQYHYSNQTQDSTQTKPLIITSKDTDGNYIAPIIGNSYWTQMGIDIDGEAAGDLSGYSVSLSSDGSIVAIGAYLNDGNSEDSNDNRGHVRIYQYDNNTSSWVKKGDDIDGEAANDYSGRSVSLSSDGKIVAIGAIYNDGNTGDVYDNRGHVRVYEWNGTAWSQLGQDIDGEAVGDRSGISVSLSGDGTIVAIGAPYNSTIGSNSGHVRVYQYDGTAWDSIGGYIVGEAAGDLSGTSVSLSSDGSIVAIGARGNDGNGSNSGRVCVYQYDGTPPLKTLGYTASELSAVGFNASQLKTLGYSSEQLNASIFDVAQLIAAGYTLTNLIDNGVLLSDLVKSFTFDQLKDVFDQLKAVFTLAEFKLEFTLAELMTVFTLAELKAVGFILAELKAAGFILDELKAVGFILAELKTVFTLAELKAEFTLAELKAEFKLTDLKAAGFILDELKAVGFLLAELKAAGFILDELKDKFTLAELNKEFTISELKDGDFTLADLKDGGINAAELHKVGYSFDQLRVAGFSAVDCRNANMSNSEIVASGFSIIQLLEGGFSAKRMKNAGYNARELYENGYPVSHLFEADYSASEIRLAGVDALQARFGGISNKEMKTAGYTVEEYKAASYKASRMKEAGYTREELTGIYNEGELDAAGF
jgi:uncharacterized protein YjbI with pentapeptide repeats